MISSVASGQINPSELMHAGQGRISKVSMPVHTTQSVCSQFKYVRGIPVSSNDPAVPLMKLKLLNGLIRSINTIYSRKGITEIETESSNIRSGQGQDALIRNTAMKLKSEMGNLNTNSHNISQSIDTTGSMFSTSA